mmetsp:Transcript_18255/g.50076  ORF Transcript_18255/g.50076 Transcript_18255/m.50076 type:complete len:94 (-) Transcript_18255:265-546(-)
MRRAGGGNSRCDCCGGAQLEALQEDGALGTEYASGPQRPKGSAGDHDVDAKDVSHIRPPLMQSHSQHVSAQISQVSTLQLSLTDFASCSYAPS